MFSIYNTTLVALMQTGVVVAGVLASGLWHRFTNGNGLPMPPLAGLLYNYGQTGLLIPLAWLIPALLLRRSSSVPDGVKSLAFILGIVLLIGLVLLVICADVAPVFNVMWNLRGDEDDG